MLPDRKRGRFVRYGSSSSDSSSDSEDERWPVQTGTDSSAYSATTDTDESATADTGPRSTERDDDDPQFAVPAVGSIASVPMQIGDGGLISMSLALVISPTMGLLLETAEGLREDGCTEDLERREKGLWLTNTHVSLETAYATTPGFEAMIVGLYWETEVGGDASLEVMEMSRHYAEYLGAVRKDGIAAAVPETLRAQLDVPLHRGAPKTKAEVEQLQRLVARRPVTRAAYPRDATCVACGSKKPCSFNLGTFPLGSDCAEVLRRAAPMCRLVDQLQRREQLPYPHEFQRMLEDAGALLR